MTSQVPLYVHGYSDIEARRLRDQADTLADLLHDGTTFPAGSKVLEVGCGTGAQTVSLAARSPAAQLFSADISATSLQHARSRVAAEAPAAEVRFLQADLFDLPFADATFDHLFVCFVIEHLPDPAQGLASLRRLLRPGGTITVIEGDHGSAFFHPAGAAAQLTIQCLIDLQAMAGGDGLIGRRLQPLLKAAGYQDVEVGPRTVYADETRPDLVAGFTTNTFNAMVAGVRAEALAAGLISENDWDAGIVELGRAAEPGGTFHYTFFKGTAVRPSTVQESGPLV
ncbi:MAG: methyltransferase domain-containing protein [Nakamurella sp.]